MCWFQQEVLHAPVFVLWTPTALPQKQVCNLLFETSLNTDACFVWRHERKPLPLSCYVQLLVCSEENQELPPICINFEVSCFSFRANLRPRVPESISISPIYISWLIRIYYTCQKIPYTHHHHGVEMKFLLVRASFRPSYNLWIQCNSQVW